MKNELQSTIDHLTEAIENIAKGIDKLKPSTASVLSANTKTIEALLAVNALTWLVTQPKLANAITSLQKANQTLADKTVAEQSLELN